MTTITPIRVFNDNAQTLLCERYYHQGPLHQLCQNDPNCGQRHETEEELIDRISLGNIDYGKMIEQCDFLPNSPTIFNLPCSICGETNVSGTLSACFKFDVEDTMDSILQTMTKAGLVLKAGGGVGYYLGNLRPHGAPVNSTHREALGPLGVLSLYQNLSEQITQGGRRDGANMAILDCDHPDIKEFIHLKDDDPDRYSDFNISVACTDEFMQKVAAQEGPEWALWKEMQRSAWETGDPGVYFVDAAERGNPTPWLGRLTGTNPCGEVPMLADEACNLGSINLSNFVSFNHSDHGVDWSRLQDTVELAVQYLDEILDLNEFPHQDITDAVALTRKLGLGVMGWADMLALLRIPYDSQEAVDLGDEVMRRINGWGHGVSNRLAGDKGRAPCFDTTSIMTRNATVTCIAPTGTISILAGCSSGIEPHFAREWTRRTGSGQVLQERIPVMDQLGDFVPKTAHEIGWDWHVQHQYVFQRHANLAVSKTINMPNDATPKDVGDAYLMMWKYGCKGGTVFRDGSRSKQVLVAEREEVVFKDSQGLLTPPPTEGFVSPGVLVRVPPTNGRQKLPAERKAINHRFQVGEQEGYLNIGLYDDGRPGELFITASQQGSTVRGLLDAVGILTSLALQYGVALEVITRKFRGMSFEPAGMTDNKEIRKATSVLDYVAHFLENRFTEVGRHEVKLKQAITQVDQQFADRKQGNGDCCPDCGATVVHEEGCEKCSHQCGWTRC